jgi:hypothetical protein
MERMPSPAKAERNQRRKLQFVPPLWPLLVGIAVIVGITILVSR